MNRETLERADTIVGPEGIRLSLADLPPPQTGRWVARRKAELVMAVRGGLLTIDGVCDRYALTLDEFLGWEQAFAQFGLAGLRAREAGCHRFRKTERPDHRSSAALSGREG
jgi:hypothetical protein